MKSKLTLALGAWLLASGAWAAPDWSADVSAQSHEIKVFRSPTCGCCKAWVSHLREHNFQVQDIETDNMASVKQALGVPAALGSCHTAQVDGKVIEGHVPANAIKAFLAKGEMAGAGLSAPGMPANSPGMEQPGSTAMDFEVLEFNGMGKVEVFERFQSQ
ncbi:DUF411 domain-containing protein [Balneatrix alpica]|uniref:DUF411 domain-containing protein n=1 Tax=Balneatrix alpica TaxID=75684 RepID=A0ABV5Z6C1_9GAMM|nr:DUF411 domain-containing protein [Balneatrix alpica]